jgi:hypothetical protein
MALDTLMVHAAGLGRKIVETAGSVPLEATGTREKQEAFIQKFQITLFKRLMDPEVDYTNPNVVNTVVENTLEDFNINTQPQETIFLKSQIQTFLTYQRLCSFAEDPLGSILKESFPDLLQGLATSLKAAPQETIHLLSGYLYWASQRPKLSVKALLENLQGEKAETLAEAFRQCFVVKQLMAFLFQAKKDFNQSA